MWTMFGRKKTHWTHIYLSIVSGEQCVVVVKCTVVGLDGRVLLVLSHCYQGITSHN